MTDGDVSDGQTNEMYDSPKQERTTTANWDQFQYILEDKETGKKEESTLFNSLDATANISSINPTPRLTNHDSLGFSKI